MGAARGEGRELEWEGEESGGYRGPWVARMSETSQATGTPVQGRNQVDEVVSSGELIAAGLRSALSGPAASRCSPRLRALLDLNPLHRDCQHVDRRPD